jgi:hypothetical protein
MLTLLLAATLAQPWQVASFVGGSGDDAIRSGFFLSDGRIVLAGTSTSTQLRAGEQRLEMGNGFVWVLDRTGTTVEWAARGAPVAAVAEAPMGLAVASGRTVRGLSLGSRSFTWTSPDLGGDISRLTAVAGGFVGLAGGNVFSIDTQGVRRWSTPVGKTRATALAADATYAYVGGDQNTNTGFEPYRSPYVFRYLLTTGAADANWRMYNWTGPDVRANGRMLQADSFVNHLQVDDTGRLWMCAGSDGGNTVLARLVRDLNQAQTALAGACYDGPCFGYQGAKKTGMFARVQPGGELDRASWVIPYVNPPQRRNTPACGCKGGFGSPNSITITSLEFPDAARVVAIGATSYRPPETTNAWFYDTVYQLGMVWVGVFDRDLRQIEMATLIPGTRASTGSDYQAGRLLVFGSTTDTSTLMPGPTETGWSTNLPVARAVQAQYGGGPNDGYFFVACLASDGGCGALPDSGVSIDAGSVQDAGLVTDGGPGGTGGASGVGGASASGGTSGDGQGGAMAGLGGITGTGGASAAGGSGMVPPPRGCGCTSIEVSTALLVLLGLGRRRALVRAPNANITHIDTWRQRSDE